MSKTETILRILLANVVVELLPLILVGVGIYLVATARSRVPRATGRFYLGASFVSLPAGVVLYIISGTFAAAIRGDGHFYSVPFGGYSVSDNAGVFLSLLTCISLVFIAMAGLFRPRT